MMKKSIAALLLSMFATLPAVAAVDGFYTGAYVGQASTDTYSLISSTDTDYSVMAGYQVMKHAAPEVQHDNIGPAADTTGYSSQIDDYGAVGFLPLNDPWSLVPKRGYANTGLGSPKKPSRSDPAYGSGGQNDFSEDWHMRANHDIHRVQYTASQDAATGAANAGTAAYQFRPDRWAGKSRGSPAFSLKIPHRYLQAAL